MKQKLIIEYKIKWLLALTFIIGFQPFASAQNPYDIYKENFFNIYGIGGLTFPYSDVQTSEAGFGIGVGLGYHILPYFEVAGDIQLGLLQEGYKTASPLAGAQYKNDFTNTTILARLIPVKIVDEYGDNKSTQYLNFTIGTGISFFKNDVKILEIEDNLLGGVHRYNKINVLFPIEFAYSIPIADSKMGQKVWLGFNYRYFFSTTDYLDGYKPNLPSNRFNDAFAQTSLSLTFSF